MADNITPVAAAGAYGMPSGVSARTTEVSAGLHAGHGNVAGWRPTSTGTPIHSTISTVVITPTLPAGTTHVLASVTAQPVCYTEEGSTPTATLGIVLPAGFVGELTVPVGGSLKFIRQGGTDGTLDLFPRKYV